MAEKIPWLSPIIDINSSCLPHCFCSLCDLSYISVKKINFYLFLGNKRLKFCYYMRQNKNIFLLTILLSLLTHHLEIYKTPKKTRILNSHLIYRIFWLTSFLTQGFTLYKLLLVVSYI